MSRTTTDLLNQNHTVGSQHGRNTKNILALTRFYNLIVKINYKQLGPLISYTRRRWWHPTPVLLPGKSHGRRSLVGCSPWGHLKSDTTERLHFHFSLSCIGEGNGNPLHCSCLENPRDGRASWAAIYGVTQSRTQLKRLSSISYTVKML